MSARLGAMATVLSGNAEGIATAAAWLQAGKCVAFPTETVYGLGANALDEGAVLNIFKYKGRPLTDPLIVHVPSVAVAETVVAVSDGVRGAAAWCAPSRRHTLPPPPQARPLFDALAAAFWPGPLTMVLKARPAVPLKVSAGTGFVGVRQPAHALAAALLEAAQLPIAAPSANRFGHVSPTAAAHVLADLGATPIAVLSAEEGAGAGEGGAGAGAPTCSVGIESTVLGISEDGQTLTMFRRGGLPVDAIEGALSAAGVAGWGWAESAAAAKSAGTAAPQDAPPADSGDAEVAPGQLLTHYAPDVPAFLLPAPPAGGVAVGAADTAPLARAVLVDFGGAYSALSGTVGAYKDLSPSGDAAEAGRGLYAALRWAEDAAAADAALTLALLPSAALAAGGQATAAVSAGAGLAAAVGDRLFRAASGRALLQEAPSAAEWTAAVAAAVDCVPRDAAAAHG